MSKKLSEMSIEELWQLFPIFLVEHNQEWSQWYKQEEQEIMLLLQGQYVKRISHIGSTAIPHIWAKNIVDILLEVASEKDIEIVKKILTTNGWICMNQNSARASLNKGYTEKGFADKVFHLHICIEGDNDELFFRDYLNEHKELAKEYEALKLSLWKEFEHDRDGYTAAKNNFVKKYTEIAKEKYKGRY